MYRPGSRTHGGFNYFVVRQITFCCRRRTDAYAFIRFKDMGCRSVGLGVYRHRGDFHPVQGADYTPCDLSAVGDKYLGKHKRVSLIPDKHLSGSGIIRITGIIQLRTV